MHERHRRHAPAATKATLATIASSPLVLTGGRRLAAVLACGVVLFAGRAGAQAPETIQVPGAGTVAIQRPAGEVRQVVLFVSGDGGWNQGVVDMARHLSEAGALVAGIDVRSLLKALARGGGCAYPAGTLEEVARAVQLHAGLPRYLRPVLVGYSSGATLVYAALVAAPAETFAGAISLGFCPDLDLPAPPCQVRGLKATRRTKGTGYDLAPSPSSTVPWTALHGDVDRVCDPARARAFVEATGAARFVALPKVGHGFAVQSRWAPQLLAAYQAIAGARDHSARPTPSVAGVQDLSLVEVPAAAGVARDMFAVLLSGDGGWADLDKQVAAGLARAGVPVVGWSSLDYFWTPRSPEGAAADLARLVEHYAAAWRKPRVMVVGYSFGADVVPYLVNRLPEAVRRRVALVGLIGPSEAASFEFHVASWLGGGGDARFPTAPEIARLAVPLVCVGAADEPASACRHAARASTVAVGRGHHFSGQYDRIVEALLH